MAIETVSSIAEAIEIAQQFAAIENKNEDRAIAFAETWFGAGKDFDLSAPSDLHAYLMRRFAEPTR